MFQDIYSYIKKSIVERQSHLNLNDECFCIGGSSQEFRGILAHFLRTTIPRGMKILLCHACFNEGCSNPKHLYWGTPKENCQDTVRSGRIPKSKNWKNKHILIASGKRMAKNLKSAKGLIWVNDGIIAKRVERSNIPKGFTIGRL